MRTVVFVAIVRIGYSCTNTAFVSRSQPHPNGWTAKFWIVNLPAKIRFARDVSELNLQSFSPM